MDRKYDVITFIENSFILRRYRIAGFPDLIKIVTMFIKTTFKYLIAYIIDCISVLQQEIRAKQAQTKSI